MKSDNKRLGKILWSFKKEYTSLLIFSMVINLLMLTPSIYMLQVYDRVLSSHDDNTLIGLSIVTIYLYAVYALLERSRGQMLVEIAERLDYMVTPLIHKHILSPTSANRQKELGAIQELMAVKQFITGQPILTLLDAPWFFIYLTVIYLLHHLLGWFSFASAILLFLLAILSNVMTSKRLAVSQQSISAERRLINNVLSASDSIQVMGMGRVMNGLMKQARMQYLDNLLVASARGVNFSALSKFFRTIIQSAALGIGAYLAITGEMSAGMIIAGSILLGKALSPIDGLITSWKQFAEFQKAYSNLDDLLGNSIKDDSSVELGRPKGNLQLINLTLRLRENGRVTLNNINLSVRAGETLAIVGPSGAGKTSLLKVLAGLLKPQQGQALLDGSDLAFRSWDDLGKFMGYLGQSTELLAGKISENIARFGQIDSKSVLKAAELSGAHPMILSLPEAYESILGDAGLGLSEGQKRKIGLARAIYADPSVILLDEPGSGLDDNSIAQVLHAIRSLKSAGATVVFTTHQSSMVQLADSVAVVMDGQIKLHGSRDEVLAKLASQQGGKTG